MDDPNFGSLNSNVVQSCRATMSELIQFGLEQINQKTVRDICKDEGISKKYCVGSTLHRGYYYPSPVYDLIVGKTKRGKVITKPGMTNNITHRYLYDREMELHWIDSLNHDKISYMETLYRKNDRIIGVTIDCNSVLAAVSQEIYQDGRIESFAILNCYDIGAGCECYYYQEERYFYDAEGLCACRFIMLSPQSQYLVNKLYEFERQEGYLTAYKEQPSDGSTFVSRRYPITKKRKA